MYVGVLHACLVLREARGVHGIPWNSTIWVLRVAPVSSVIAASALDHLAISSHLTDVYL